MTCEVGSQVNFGANLRSQLRQKLIFIFLKKRASENDLKKRGPPNAQMGTYSQVGRLPGKLPRVRAFQTRNSCLSNS